MTSVASIQPFYTLNQSGNNPAVRLVPAFNAAKPEISDSVEIASKKQPAYLTGITVEDLYSGNLSLSKRFGLGMIAMYQWLTHPHKVTADSPQNKFFTCYCNPSCSTYTAQSIKQHGLIKGSYMGLKQICTKCYPFQPVMTQHGFKKGIPMVLKAIAYEMGLSVTQPSYKEAYDQVKTALKPPDKTES